MTIKRTSQEIQDIAVSLFHHRDNGYAVGCPSTANMSEEDSLKGVGLYDKLREAEDKILAEYEATV